jgi:formylglycine-generating enzyme required for sulfatase activity
MVRLYDSRQSVSNRLVRTPEDVLTPARTLLSPVLKEMLDRSRSTRRIQGVRESPRQPSEPVMNDRVRISTTSIGLVTIGVALVLGIRLTWSWSRRGMTAPDLIVIPAGEFTMGSDVGDPDAQPARQIYLKSFRIARYEVTNAQYAQYLNVTDEKVDRCGGHICLDTQLENPQSHILCRQGRYVVEEGYEQHPVRNVSWYGAQAYCEYLDMRLPTEAEWEKAARGSDGRTYPWGNTADPTKLNAGGRIGDTTAVGSHPDGASPYGVQDMAGNVWEWTADWYEAYPGNRYRSSFFGQNYKVVRGGSWNHPDTDARAAHRDMAHPARRIHVVGFRCARDR